MLRYGSNTAGHVRDWLKSFATTFDRNVDLEKVRELSRTIIIKI